MPEAPKVGKGILALTDDLSLSNPTNASPASGTAVRSLEKRSRGRTLHKRSRCVFVSNHSKTKPPSSCSSPSKTEYGTKTTRVRKHCRRRRNLALNGMDFEVLLRGR